MQSNLSKNIFQINAEKGISFLYDSAKQPNTTSQTNANSFQTPLNKRSNLFLEMMSTDQDKFTNSFFKTELNEQKEQTTNNSSQIKRELSPGLLSEGLEVEDLHYYIDQRFDTTPKIDAYVCGKKRRRNQNIEEQQVTNIFESLKDETPKKEELDLQKQLKFIY